jgi:hypothetical protein
LHEMQLSNDQLFIIPCAYTNDYKNIALVFKSSFVWYLAMLNGEIASATTQLSRIRDMIVEKFDIYKPRSSSRGVNVGEQSVVKHTRNTMALSTGGNPSIEASLRICDARRDKISIVLNCVGNGLVLKRDENLLKTFSSDDECFRQLLTIALAAGDALSLCCTGPSLQTRSQKSWLNRPNVNARDIGSNQRKNELPSLPIAEIQIDDSTSSRWIQMNGFMIDNEVSPSEYTLTAAVFMTLQCQRLGMGVQPTGNHIPQFTGPGYIYWDHAIQRDQDFSCFTRTIAAVLHCGPDWMVKTAETCGFPQDQIQSWRENFLTSLQAGIDIPGLPKMSWAASEIGRNGVRSIMRFTMWLITWGVSTIHGHAFLHPGPESWFPVIYVSATGSDIMIFSRFAATPGKDRSLDKRALSAFVPECLAVEGYEKLARCWLVTPTSGDEHLQDDMSRQVTDRLNTASPENTMILDSKTRIFSAGPIEQAGFVSKLLSQVRIYGPS